MELLISALIGIPLGILASLVAWWIQFCLITPKIRFSPFISKLYFKDAGTRYRLKIKNFGKRGIIDIEVFPILRIKGLRPELPNNWTNITLATTLTNNRISSLKVDRIFSILPESNTKFSDRIFPENIRKKYKNQELNLEDLLELGGNVKLVVQLFGYDEFSGSRKLFESNSYALKDIKYGKFDNKHMIDETGLQIVERMPNDGNRIVVS
jgi:hypothetical protein